MYYDSQMSREKAPRTERNPLCRLLYFLHIRNYTSGSSVNIFWWDMLADDLMIIVDVKSLSQESLRNVNIDNKKVVIKPYLHWCAACLVKYAHVCAVRDFVMILWRIHTGSMRRIYSFSSGFRIASLVLGQLWDCQCKWKTLRDRVKQLTKNPKQKLNQTNKKYNEKRTKDKTVWTIIIFLVMHYKYTPCSPSKHLQWT